MTGRLLEGQWTWLASKADREVADAIKIVAQLVVGRAVGRMHLAGIDRRHFNL